jgi:HEXXH motif-containing protein
VNFTFRLEAPARLVTAAGDVVSLSGQVFSADLAAAVGRPGAAGRPMLPLVGARAGIQSKMSGDEVVRAIESIAARLPRVADWVAEAAKLAGILEPESKDSFASASYPEVPGYIALSPSGDVMQVLEAVVHETAHLYFFRYESDSPLVRPSMRRFESPLRPDPRPLRGILLAMHACAYVSAAFAEAEAAQLEHPERCSAQRREILALFDQARGVVESAAHLLTPRGAAFVERTADVAARASLRAAA